MTEHKRVAAIDLGTNSFHMVIVEESPEKGIVEIDRVKDMICIGRGSISTKMLNEEAIESGVATLKHFVLLASQHGVEPSDILAFATSAIREAHNRDVFLRRVLEETGLKVKVITGAEEAQFIYYGVRNAVELSVGSDLLFDIGGGSVEFVIADNRRVHLLESRKIGVARMHERFITTDPLSRHELNLLDQFFCAELHTSVEKARQMNIRRAIASSGTAQNIARMIRYMTGRSGEVALNNSSFTRKEFQKLYKPIIGLTSAERRKLTGLDEKRVDLIIPGMVLVDVIFRVFKLKEIVISDSALREGMVIQHLLQRNGRSGPGVRQQVDIRRQSVIELAYRCQWDRQHSSHIARLCRQLFDQLQPLHGLGLNERELLEHAALLHNIGTFISISGHHKHSQYIIINGELRGFTPVEISMIACVARYHRKSPPSEKHELYASLKSKSRRAVDVMAGILRIANGLDRGHRCNILAVEAGIDNGTITLGLKARQEPDIEIWAAERMKSWLETVTGKTISFHHLGRL
ncbi:Ppx/GppA family phosphatase [Prosthecochloris sp. N3]|uniref:Ppx/GppA family phosphatase n=1 Tax=Prosthecochloris ethylica TaxID=2743976 RepID=A0ABR9XQ53_9CHLB|nr:Ppx/GppA phosphatase family protein [Prosthecochloris ethylica]MBF0586549.1 Ppx/GppA family phosphatase [Prosthecochloris ethylica]MBF0636162.1 Ppx/GppA family phosphatase [Prosthecochloris ethylica]NUK47701.1 Ppx/GppA family phosphatase [Prosthecochloris ethylica]